MDWLSIGERILPWIGLVSIASLLLTLIAVPLIVARLPANYFIEKKQRGKPSNSLLGVAGRVAKNLVGLTLVLIGLALLVLPGQGILTVLVGLVIVDFPGKYSVERWMIRRPGVARTINWIRRKAAKPPLKIPNGSSSKLPTNHTN